MGYAMPVLEGVLSGAAEYTKTAGPKGTTATPTSNKGSTAMMFGDIAKMAQGVYAQHLLNKQLSGSIKAVKKEKKAIERSNQALLRDSTEQRRSFLSQELS